MHYYKNTLQLSVQAILHSFFLESTTTSHTFSYRKPIVFNILSLLSWVLFFNVLETFVMDQESSVSSQKVSKTDSETVIQIRENETADPNDSSLVIDVKELVAENQRVCRICHLSSKESGNSSMELIELGCGCKGELSVAHSVCGETWFRVKGNRMCEICGQLASNITGMRDNGFLEEWNEMRPDNSGFNNSSDGQRTCLGRQPLCNFLMACLVVAFILPWFFRVQLF